jgi:hypothetical protein
VLLAVGALLLPSCGGDNPTQPPAPTPTPPPAVVPGQATGPTQIVFVSGDPAPGSSVPGCGPDIGGCAGRVRMTFELRPSQTGFALGFRAFLHDSSKRACLIASKPSFERQLQAGQPATVEVVFDQSDRCGTPVTITNMDAALEGTIEVASRQEWGLRYSFLP